MATGPECGNYTTDAMNDQRQVVSAGAERPVVSGCGGNGTAAYGAPVVAPPKPIVRK